MRLLLLNGVYGAPEHFDSLREALAPEIETKVFPLRREGLPDPDSGTGFAPLVERLDREIAAFTGPLAAGPTALLGFSLGGALALEYALAHPGRLAALVLVNAFARYEGGALQVASSQMLHGMPPAWAHPSLAARLVHRLDWVKRGLFHREAPLETIEQGMRAAVREVKHEDVRFQLAHLGLPFPVGHERRLAALAESTPVLLVASRDDMVVPSRHTDRLAAAMPAAKRLPLFEGGHAFFQHDARRLGSAVRSFLAESVR